MAKVVFLPAFVAQLLLPIGLFVPRIAFDLQYPKTPFPLDSCMIPFAAISLAASFLWLGAFHQASYGSKRRAVWIVCVQSVVSLLLAFACWPAGIYASYSADLAKVSCDLECQPQGTVKPTYVWTGSTCVASLNDGCTTTIEKMVLQGATEDYCTSPECLFSVVRGPVVMVAKQCTTVQGPLRPFDESGRVLQATCNQKAANEAQWCKEMRSAEIFDKRTSKMRCAASKGLGAQTFTVIALGAILHIGVFLGVLALCWPAKFALEEPKPEKLSGIVIAENWNRLPPSSGYSSSTVDASADEGRK